MSALTLTVNALHKEEMEYHGKFVHNLRRIKHIALMSRIEICYKAFCLANKTVAPTIPGFQGIKRCIQYLDNNLHTHIFYPSYYYYGSKFIRLTWSGNQF